MAEDANTTDKDQDTTTQNEDNSTAEKPEKTLTVTQAQIDALIDKRYAEWKSKSPSDDELKAFKDWKKSQQTEAEKAAEREKALSEASAKVTALERENAIIKAGVKSEDVDYVLYKVSKLEGDFSKNLGAFLTENKKFTEPETTIVDGMKHNPGGSNDPAERLIASMKEAAGVK